MMKNAESLLLELNYLMSTQNMVTERKKAASIILGATDFTFAKAKAQAMAYAKKYNLKAPY